MSRHSNFTPEEFLADVKEHGIEVVRDDGLYRHVKFRRPETICMSFNLITWPGYLCYCGDMGAFVFSRLPDMFQFFRRDNTPHIDYRYWAEKCEAADNSSGIKVYSAERFREHVNYRLEEDERVTDEIRQAVDDEVLCYADDEHEAIGAAMAFQHDKFRLDDFWECDCTEFTFRFLWCCHAIAWGIEQYDKHKEAVPA